MTRAQRKEAVKQAVLSRLTPPAPTPNFDAVAALDAMERAGGRAVFRGDRLYAGVTIMPGTHADWMGLGNLVELGFGRSVTITTEGVRCVIARRWARK